MPPDAPAAPVLARTRAKGYAVTTDWWDGYPPEWFETAPELKWPDSVLLFDQMRRTDAAVGSVLRAVRLSLGRLAWHVDPADADPTVVRFVARNLNLPILGEEEVEPPRRLRGRFSFTEHLRLAQLALVYGHMPFAQEYEPIFDGDLLDRPYQVLHKLSPRMPQTLAKINVATDGGLVSIEQYPLSGLDPRKRRQNFDNIEIKVKHLVMYCHEREGGAWQGTSLLRPIYKHWLLKDRLLRVDTAAAQRNGMGVPWITAPEGASDADLARYAEIAAGFRAGEEAGGAGPAGTKLELVGVSGQLPDVLARIRYHDEMISQNLFAQFLKLGTTSTGSRALGDSFVDFFLQAVDALALEFLATFNAHVVEDIVDVNFTEGEPAPRVVAAPAKERQSLSATEIIALAQAGLLTYDATIEAYVRERYGLPRSDQEGQAVPAQSTPAPQPVADGDPAEPREDNTEDDG